MLAKEKNSIMKFFIFIIFILFLNGCARSTSHVFVLNKSEEINDGAKYIDNEEVKPAGGSPADGAATGTVTQTTYAFGIFYIYKRIKENIELINDENVTTTYFYVLYGNASIESQSFKKYLALSNGIKSRYTEFDSTSSGFGFRHINNYILPELEGSYDYKFSRKMINTFNGKYKTNLYGDGPFIVIANASDVDVKNEKELIISYIDFSNININSIPDFILSLSRFNPSKNKEKYFYPFKIKILNFILETDNALEDFSKSIVNMKRLILE